MSCKNLQFIAKVYIVKKCTDCESVLFVEGLVKCKRVVEDILDFGVFLFRKLMTKHSIVKV